MRTLGQIGSEAYLDDLSSFEGLDEHLDEAGAQKAWEAAGLAIQEEVIERCAKAICVYCAEGRPVHMETDAFGNSEYYHNNRTGEEAIDCDAHEVRALKDKPCPSE